MFFNFGLISSPSKISEALKIGKKVDPVKKAQVNCVPYLLSRGDGILPGRSRPNKVIEIPQ